LEPGSARDGSVPPQAWPSPPSSASARERRSGARSSVFVGSAPEAEARPAIPRGEGPQRRPRDPDVPGWAHGGFCGSGPRNFAEWFRWFR